MSQPVTTQDTDLRARLRPLGHAVRPAAYRSRPVSEPSRKLFQDVTVLQDFQFPAVFNPSPSQAAVQVTLPKPAAEPLPRQTFSTVPHKPAPSQVLMRQAVKPGVQTANQAETTLPVLEPDIEPLLRTVTPRPELHSNFAPPPKAPRFTVPKVIFIKKLRAMSFQQRLLTGLATLVLLAGSGLSLLQLHANHIGQLGASQASVAGIVPATTTNSTSTAPNTAPVTADTLRSYQVAPDAARYISISKLGVLARVLQVGVTKTGAMATPSNVNDTAWYKASSKPGQPGATLIDGHVSSWTTNGVFYNLKKLTAGDRIEIERGDGSKLSYSVVQTTTYPKDAVDMPVLMKPITVGKSGLNLITCGGKFDKSAGEFTERVAVFAVLDE